MRAAVFTSKARRQRRRQRRKNGCRGQSREGWRAPEGGRPNKRIERIPRGRGLAKSWEHVCRSVKMGAVLRGQGPIPEPSKSGRMIRTEHQGKHRDHIFWHGHDTSRLALGRTQVCGCAFSHQSLFAGVSAQVHSCRQGPVRANTSFNFEEGLCK